MIRAIEAIIDENGSVKLKERVHLQGLHRAIVTILDEDADLSSINATALLSEEALSKDWNREEEDKAWSHLQPVK